MNLISIVRWIHILAGAAWLGELATIGFVILPLVASLERDASRAYIAQTFPRLFRLASVLAAITLSAGAGLNYLLTGWRNLTAYFSGYRGGALLVGATLGLALALFHFFVEVRLERRVMALVDQANDQEFDQIIRFLQVVPRAGLVIIISIVLLMMIGARGF